MKNIIQIFRPLLSNMMGAMGQHMEILVFPSVDKAGQPIADPKKDGSLTVHLGDLALRYRLPSPAPVPQRATAGSRLTVRAQFSGRRERPSYSTVAL
jgi:hypothetical protein